MLVQLTSILKGLPPMPPPGFYNNRIFKDSCHQAEVGGFPRVKLLPLLPCITMYDLSVNPHVRVHGVVQVAVLALLARLVT